MTIVSVEPAVSSGSSALWPRYAGPTDLEAIEAAPLAARRLPRSTDDALRASARGVPSRTALIVLPDGDHWDSPVEVTYRELLHDVHRIANSLTSLGIGREDAVGLLSPNVEGLVPAVLAAQATAIAVPVNPALGRAQVTELLRRAGARVLIAAGPEIAPIVWDMACSIAGSLQLDAVLALRPTRPEHARSSGYDSWSASGSSTSTISSQTRTRRRCAAVNQGGTTSPRSSTAAGRPGPEARGRHP